MSDKYLKDFIEASEAVNFKLNIDLGNASYSPLQNDALFHIPFIAMSILALTRDRKFQPTTGNVGQLVGQVFERTFPAFKTSNQMLSWSANLRARTALAQAFLEQAKLITMSDSKLQLTEDGRTVINKVFNEESSLGLAIRAICRNYRDFSEETQLSLG